MISDENEYSVMQDLLSANTMAKSLFLNLDSVSVSAEEPLRGCVLFCSPLPLVGSTEDQ